MKLHQLRAVVAIAEFGSLREAARQLRQTQPALTRSLGELERELKAELFHRRASGMVPTRIGEPFVRRAAAVLNDLRKARDEVEQLGTGVTGRVAVGLSIAPHLAMLPRVLGPFRARFPGVQLDIVEGFYPTLEGGLRDGSIDFAIGPDPGEALAPGLVATPMFANNRVVLCRRGHPLRGATRLGELIGAEWATTTITKRAEAEYGALFASHGLPMPRLSLRSQSALTLMIVIANSDLLALVPQQWAGSESVAAGLAQIAIREVLPAPTIVQVRRGDLPLTPAATLLSDLMFSAVPPGAAPA